MSDERDGAERELELARMRAAFSASNERAEGSGGCPEPDRIWQAVAGELPRAESAELILHTAACGACAEIWRVGHRMAPALEAPPAQARWRANRTLHRLAIVAAAATVLFGVVSVIQFRNPVRSPEEQSRERAAGETAPIYSLTPEDTPLPRAACLLRWSSAGEGTIYEIRVSTETLQVISSAKHLTAPEYLVPKSELAGLPPRARILWQVESLLADGSRATSPTMISRVE